MNHFQDSWQTNIYTGIIYYYFQSILYLIIFKSVFKWISLKWHVTTDNGTQHFPLSYRLNPVTQVTLSDSETIHMQASFWISSKPNIFHCLNKVMNSEWMLSSTESSSKFTPNLKHTGHLGLPRLTALRWIQICQTFQLA